MRRASLLLFGAIALLVATIAGPASAAPAHEPVGDRVVVILGGVVELEAGEAFHVEHGWGVAVPEQAPVGHWGFGLDIDGVDQGHGKKITSAAPPDDVGRTVLYNYPEGLPAGEYVFQGHWFGPCVEIAAVIEADGFPPIECEFKNAQVDYPIDLVEGFSSSVLVIVTD